MALTDLTRISTSGIATGSTIDSPILRKDVDFRGDQVGVGSVLFDSSERELNFKDNVKLRFGDSADLSLWAAGGASYIRESGGSGQLVIQGSNLILESTGGTDYFYGIDGGTTAICHGGSAKVQTTSTGAIVTGILTATGSFSGQTYNTAGIATFYNLRVSNDLTVEGTTTTLDTNLIGVDRVEVGANSNTTVAVSVAQTGTADIINLFDGTSEVLTVIDGGKVGIGTVSPDRIVHVFEPTENNLLFLESGDTNVDIIQADTGGSTRIRNSQGSLVFYVNGDASSNSAANAVTGLTIDGDKDVHVYDDLFIPDKIIHEGDTNTAIRFPAADTFTVETAGDERLRITSDAKIKVNCPASKVGITTGSLDVWGDATSYPTIRLGSLDLNEEGEHIRFGRKDISADIRYHSIWGRNSATSGSNYLAFKLHDGSGSPYTGQTEVLRLTGDGNVGVGIDSPKKAFNIVAGVGTTEFIRLSQPVDASVQQNFGIGWCSNNDHVWPGAQITSLEYDVSDTRRNLNFYTRGTNSDIAPTERMRISHDGNVAIGTDAYGNVAPLAPLHVSSYSPTTAVTDHNTLRGASQLVLQTSNNVNDSRSGLMFSGALHSTDGCSAGIIANHENVAENSEQTSLSFYTSHSEQLGEALHLHSTSQYARIVDILGLPAHLRLNSIRNTSDWDASDAIGKLDFYVGHDTTNNLPYNAGFIHCLNETDNADEPSGALVFGTTLANASGGALERLRINSAGNVSLGAQTNNSDIHSSFRCLQVYKSAYIWGYSSGSYPAVHITNNARPTTSSFTGGWKRDIAGTYTAPVQLELYTGNFSVRTADNSTADSAITWDTRFTVKQDGKVGINKSNPDSQLQIGTPNSATGVLRADPGYFSIDSGYANGGSVGGVVGSATNAALIFGGDSNTGLYHSASDTINFTTAGVEKVRIPDATWGLLVTNLASTGSTGGYQTEGVSLRYSGDSTLVRTDAPPVTMTRKGNAGKVLDFYSGTTYAGGIYVNGSNNTALQQGSDYRLKTDITSMTDGINKVKQLNPIYYKANSGFDTTTVQNGFLAHEVQSVLPTLVDGEKDAPIDEKGKGYQTLNYAGFTPTAIAAIKELIAKVETLEAKVATLEGS